MEDFKNKAENLKDKVVGESKEAYGKLTNDKSTEVEGKVQSGVADVKDKAIDVKNEVVDKVDETNHKHHLSEKVGEVAEDAKIHAEHLGEDIKEKAEDFKDFAAEKIEDIKNKFKK